MWQPWSCPPELPSGDPTARAQWPGSTQLPLSQNHSGTQWLPATHQAQQKRARPFCQHWWWSLLGCPPASLTSSEHPCCLRLFPPLSVFPSPFTAPPPRLSWRLSPPAPAPLFYLPQEQPFSCASNLILTSASPGPELACGLRSHSQPVAEQVDGKPKSESQVFLTFGQFCLSR